MEVFIRFCKHGKRDKILNYQMCKHSIVYFSFMLYCIVKTLNLEKTCFGRIFSVPNLCTHKPLRSNIFLSRYIEKKMNLIVFYGLLQLRKGGQTMSNCMSHTKVNDWYRPIIISSFKSSSVILTVDSVHV